MSFKDYLAGMCRMNYSGIREKGIMEASYEAIEVMVSFPKVVIVQRSG